MVETGPRHVSRELLNAIDGRLPKLGGVAPLRALGAFLRDLLVERGDVRVPLDNRLLRPEPVGGRCDERSLSVASSLRARTREFDADHSRVWFVWLLKCSMRLLCFVSLVCLSSPKRADLRSDR